MPAPNPVHWQQFQSNDFDVLHMDWRSAPTLQTEPRFEPRPSTLDSSWLFGAGTVAALFFALWLWQDLSDLPVSLAADPRPARALALPAPRSAGVMTNIERQARRPRPAAPSGDENTAVEQVFAPLPVRRLAPAPRNRAPAYDAPSARPIASGKPDMDLMDVPSSPLEQMARYASRARTAQHATPRGRIVAADIAPSMTIDPPHFEPGTLRINSRPWAQVHVDGHHVGNTPLRAFRLSAGEHNVCLKNPDFGMARCFDVTIVAGESVTRIETLEE